MITKKFGLMGVLLVVVFAVTGCGDGGESGKNSGDQGATQPAQNVTLKVDKFGDGVVLSDRSGINCGTDCVTPYSLGTTVVLTAIPDPGSKVRSWVGCDSGAGDTCIVTMKADRTVFPTFALIDMVVPETTKVLDDSEMQLLVKQEGSIYYFGQGAVKVSALKAGDIIMSSSGAGLLRRVTAVSTTPDGLIVVETTEATLEEAMETGTIAFSKKLTQADVISGKPLRSGVKMAKPMESTSVTFPPLEVDLDIDGIKVSGNVALEFEADFAASVDLLLRLKELKAILITKATQNLSISAGGTHSFIDKKIPIFVYDFVPIPTGLPGLVVFPKATVYVGIQGEAGGALSTGITMEETYTAGIHFKKGTEPQWSPVSEYSKDFGFDPPTVSAGATIKGYVNPYFEFTLNKIAGPYIDAEGYLKLDAGISNAPPSSWWSLYAGIGASAGANIGIFSWTVAEYRVDLFPDLEWLLATGSNSVDITSPSVPASLTVGAASTSQINLSWAAAADDVGVSGYKVYRNGNYLKSVNGTSTSDANLNPSTQYCYAVSAFDAAGNESDKSSQKCATTQSAMTIPNVPNSLQASAVSTSQINLSWTDTSNNEDGFKIERKTGTAGTYSQITTVGAGSAIYSNAGLSAGTTFCYRVRAYNGAGNSGYSNEACAMTSSNTLPPPTPTFPVAPSSLSSTALSSSIIALVWQDNSDSESGFKIERKTGTSGSFSQIATAAALPGSGSGGYFEDSNLSASTAYCYRLRAYNAAGDSIYSNESCATTQNQPSVVPSVTTSSAANVTSTSATLNGTVNPNGVATGAFFQWGTSTTYGNLTTSQTLGSGTGILNVSASVSGLSPNTVYHFRSVAANSTGGTTFGADQTFATLSAGCSEIEPNDSSLQATSLTLNVGCTGTISSSTDKDWFEVEVNSGTTITITLQVPAGLDYDMALYGPDRSNPLQHWLKESLNPAGQSESITYTTTATGSFVIQVYGVGGASSTTSRYTITRTQ